MEELSLINDCIKGESGAQKQLYEKYAPAMMGICLRYVHERETARDLMHDGFVVLFTKIHTYSGNGSFPAWVKKIFVNTALEYLRKNDILRFSTDIDDAYCFENTDFTVFEQLSANELLECICKLPDCSRTVFNMYAIEGYSHAEIAQILNIQESTSRSQYVRARQSLQKMVTKQIQFLVQ
ncbi:MAG: sigma-70 family RNA polymerase sigma factor [Dysgonamonadaceae bacterium]|jgi:RNA polymerase sigma-70 factor (ECF subfamily)|nr:sigma-70 family RNA polymerase sigma factor [Dysgonamonadaceae bacterium]